MSFIKLDPNDGLEKRSDSSPLSVTMDTGISALYDGDKSTGIGNYWNSQDSFGIDLGLSKNVDKIICYHNLTTKQGWYNDDWGIVAVYKSDDNSSWTFVEEFVQPPTNNGEFILTLSSTQNARYFKVRDNGGHNLCVSDGDNIYVTEIEMFQQSLYYFSGYVFEQGSPAQRKLYLHYRDDGSLVDTTTSSGNGYYYLETTYSGSHYIVCLDDEAGEDYNDMIIGNVFPEEVV